MSDQQQTAGGDLESESGVLKSQAALAVGLHGRVAGHGLGERLIVHNVAF
jgi:hypothetical protein